MRRKIKGLTGLVDQPPKKVWDREEYSCKIPWRWETFIQWDEKRDGPIEKANLEQPMFMIWRTSKPFEPWPLEMIRRKFYIDLDRANDFERDVWMPKAISLLQWILVREMISLYAVADFFGMPTRYLANLSRRDPKFRRWVAWCRAQNIDHKAWEAIESKAHGQKSCLQRIKPESNGTAHPHPPFPVTIDIGWKPKVYARRKNYYTKTGYFLA